MPSSKRRCWAASYAEASEKASFASAALSLSRYWRVSTHLPTAAHASTHSGATIGRPAQSPQLVSAAAGLS